MANTHSAKKNIRKTARQTIRNRVIKSRLKSLRKNVNQAATSGDAQAARQAAINLVSAVDKAAKTKVIHRNAAKRMKSAYAKHIFN